MVARSLLSEDLRDLKTYEEFQTLAECLGLRSDCSHTELVGSIRDFIGQKLQEKKGREKEAKIKQQEENDQIRALYSGYHSEDKDPRYRWEQQNIPMSNERANRPEETSKNSGLWQKHPNNHGEASRTHERNVEVQIKDEKSEAVGLWNNPTQTMPIDRSTQTDGRPVNRTIEIGSSPKTTLSGNSFSGDINRYLEMKQANHGNPSFDGQMQIPTALSIANRAHGDMAWEDPRLQQPTFQMSNTYQQTYVPGQYAPQGQAMSRYSSKMSEQQQALNIDQTQTTSMTPSTLHTNTSQPKVTSTSSKSSGGDDGGMFFMSM